MLVGPGRKSILCYDSELYGFSSSCQWILAVLVTTDWSLLSGKHLIQTRLSPTDQGRGWGGGGGQEETEGLLLSQDLGMIQYIHKAQPYSNWNVLPWMFQSWNGRC